LQNLIQNSIQAAGPDTQISLDISPSKQHSGMLALRLTDNGPGVAPALRDSLFEPFVTGRVQGTGLGLAVVQAVAHSHQGSVQYIPTEHGACFEMLLPIQQPVSGE
jgi:two-component system sensor histidine kinase FlrB